MSGLLKISRFPGPVELFDYQSRTDLFTAVAGVLPINANVTTGDVPTRVEMMLVSWNYFSILGVAPAYGRVFAPEDDVPGVANVAVVSDGFWHYDPSKQNDRARGMHHDGRRNRRS